MGLLLAGAVIVYSTIWTAIRTAREHEIKAESRFGAGHHDESVEELRLSENATRV